ncbi:uncharacterized protein LOC62_03G004924 [Vanrija pseudolonga]|uniref:BZIP domain-containing protein n=1 Tax=Vanrija pseudolonga TaxID=143232 RepID=A0AAF0YAV9_9TREE|nr:hypothetical protein LOC62_03G004924 [Vanrija pseudolonga]
MPRAAGSSTVLGGAVATVGRPPDAPRQRHSDAASGSRSAHQSISTAPIVDLASFVATYTAAQSSASAARGSAPETPVMATAAATSDRTNANTTAAPPTPPTGVQVPNGQVVVPRGSSSSSSSTQRHSQIAPIESGTSVPTEENNNLRSAVGSAVDAGGDRHSTPSATHETQNSRQKRKEEYDYLQANLDRKDTEIEQLQKRCTHLEQYCRPRYQTAVSKFPRSRTSDTHPFPRRRRHPPLVR